MSKQDQNKPTPDFWDTPIEDFFNQPDENGAISIDVDHVQFEKGKVIAGVMQSIETDPWPHVVLQKGRTGTDLLGVSLNYELRKFIATWDLRFKITALQITPIEKIPHGKKNLWQLKIVALNIDGSKIQKRDDESKEAMQNMLEEITSAHNAEKEGSGPGF